MENTPKQTESTQVQPGDPSEGNPFVTGAGISPPKPEAGDFQTIKNMQNSQDSQKAKEAEAARRIVDAAGPNDTTGWSTGRKIVAGAVLGVGLVTGGLAVADNVLPGEVIASSTGTVEEGEGLEEVIDRNIADIESKKIDPADTTERQDVIIQAMAIHAENGNVQPGQQVTVIAEKSPIFGNVSYTAVPETTSDIQSPTE